MKNKNVVKQKSIAAALAFSVGAVSGDVISASDPIKDDQKIEDTELEHIEVYGSSFNPYKVEKVNSHKIPTKLVDTAKTITVLDSSLLQAQGVTSLNDALSNVSGVSTFGAGEGGGGNISTNDKITIRGFDANGNIYIDGVRDIAGYSRDNFNTEQIEIGKGGSSSIIGKGSSGGTVNIVTKRAKMRDFTSVNASYDEGGTYRIAGDYNAALSDDVAFRVNALITEGGDYLDNDVENFETQAIAPAVTVKLGEQTTLSAFAMLMKQDNTPVLGLPFVTDSVAENNSAFQVGPISSDLWSNYYGVKGLDFEEVDAQIATLVVEHNFSDNFTLRNQTRIGNNDRKSLLTRPRFNNSGTRSEPVYNGEVDISWTQNRDEEVSLFVNQLDAIVDVDYGSVKHNVVIGLEYYQEDKSSARLTASNITRSSDTVDLVNPDRNVTFTGGVETDGEPSKTDSTGVAVYALNNINVDDKFLFTAGLRYEDFEAEGSRYVWERIDGRWVSEYADGLEAGDQFVSWNLSAGYKPTDDGFVYLAASNSQDPSGSNLAFTWSRDAIDRFNELDPEESKNYEAGVKWELADGKLLLNAAYFLTRKTVLDRNDQREYFLAGEQEAKGLELSAVGSITENLSISASYTNQKTEITKDFSEDSQGDGLSSAPEDSVGLWLNYKASERFVLGLGSNYNSGNVYWRRSRPYFDTGSVTLINAMAAYKVTENLAVQFNVSNLTDEEYVRDYSARGHFRPGTPRNIKVGVTYNF